ncbi:hypothetical protein D9757_006808 [Collybiopsis confluens]|uniref:Cytochrome P450 n=1 Tax=Collybiopsis confluens TaxID=2823264 RepID=A0A8H5HPW9_9AGAR|nr:hypothetical protein D9757_012859 [Collybiopsis confluens]KAF5387280.1 hypothetical protein D9757_006808 [Collybiopsis confluens]
MNLLAFILLSFVFVAVYVVYNATKRSVLDKLPGPPSKSFLLGNMADLMQNQAGLTEFLWQEAYGDVVKFKAPLGMDRLLISDPKAMQHILQTSGYRWAKYPERKEISRLSSGKGLLWADGDVHRRQRKVMLPGFGTPEAKNFLPLFFSCAASMTRRWSDILSISTDQSHVFNIPEWVSRATLDAIGQAAFDYDFGATDDDESELGQVMKAFGAPSKATLVILELLHFLPKSMLEFINNIIPGARHSYLRHASKVANKTAKKLVEDKSDALLEGRGKRDIMTLLVQANAGENPKAKLTEVELLSQMRVIILAGHEVKDDFLSAGVRKANGTFIDNIQFVLDFIVYSSISLIICGSCADTLSWLLYELVKNTKLQDELRAEIRTFEKAAAVRGDSELNIHDLEGMPLLGATETLRFHPVAIHVFRAANEDDILPLTTPITTTTGEVLTELPISKGTRAILSLPAYNRNKAIFGEDAHTFNPYRWLEPHHVKKGVALGPFANLATFSAGIRVCIGWRFAVIELQAFIVELLRNFEFSSTPKVEKLRREAALVMIPTIEGERESGRQLPLRVAFARREE